MGKRPRVMFYVDIDDKSELEIVSFYKNDINILQDLSSELGYEFSIGTKPDHLRQKVDVYYAWWATTGIMPVLTSKLHNASSILVAGGSEIVNTSNETMPDFYSERSLWHRLAIKSSLHLADIVTVPSRHLAEEAKNLGRENSKVINHCIDTNRYAPSSTTNQSTNFTEKQYILTISKFTDNHVKRKRLREIIDAIGLLSDEYHLVIAGSDLGAHERLKEYIKNCNLNNQVTLIRDLTEKKKINLLQEAQIYLQPTLHEGFGLAILEAMSVGLPIITSKRGAVTEVVGSSGVYVSPHDSKEMAEEIETLWNDKYKREELGEQARKRAVSNFSYQKRKEQIKDMLSSEIPVMK